MIRRDADPFVAATGTILQEVVDALENFAILLLPPQEVLPRTQYCTPQIHVVPAQAWTLGRPGDSHGPVVADGN